MKYYEKYTNENKIVIMTHVLVKKSNIRYNKYNKKSSGKGYFYDIMKKTIKQRRYL